SLPNCVCLVQSKILWEAMYFKNLLLNSFFLFLFFGAFAQNESVIREQIHSNDGLPLGWVTGVAQDPRGFIWIGGKKKIFRYDGFSLLQIDANSTLLPLDFNDNCEIAINKKGELLVMDRSNF